MKIGSVTALTLLIMGSCKQDKKINIQYLVPDHNRKLLNGLWKRAKTELNSLANHLHYQVQVAVIAQDDFDSYEDLNVMEERCKYFGGDDSYNNYVFGSGELKYCIQNILNIDEIKAEMDEAKILGDLDEVFMKHCKDKERILNCTQKWTQDKIPCLSPEERPNIDFIHNVTAAAFDFACAHRGERIAYFLAEGGGECMNRSEIRTAMEKCNEFIDPFYEVNSNSSIDASSTCYQYPYYRLNKTDCEKLEDFRGCVVAVLEKCSDPTPSNFADSLFRYVYKRTKCNTSSGDITKSSIVVILSYILFVFSLKIFVLYS